MKSEINVYVLQKATARAGGGVENLRKTSGFVFTTRRVD